MKTYKVSHMVKMEDLNHHKNLYAGRAIEWMMEASFVAAASEVGEPEGLFYKNTHQFSFERSIVPGEIISYLSTIVRTGKTSLTLHVDVRSEIAGDRAAEGYVTYVSVKPGTHDPASHGISLDEPEDSEEQRWRREAEHFFAERRRI